MAAQHEAGVADIAEAATDGRGPGLDEPAAELVLHEVAIVVGRRCVKEPDGKAITVGVTLHGQGCKPAVLGLVQLLAGEPVGEIEPLALRLDHPAVVVAPNGRQVERHQAGGGLRRPEWARDAIAEIDDAFDAAPSDVGQHGLQGKEVSVDVGDDGEFHDALRCGVGGA